MFGEWECSAFELASLLGYNMNIVQYWEVQYNQHLQDCGHANIDKAEVFVALGSLAAADPTAVVLFMDSSDTLVQLPPEVIMERFLRKYLEKGKPADGMMFVATEVRGRAGGRGILARAGLTMGRGPPVLALK